MKSIAIFLAVCLHAISLSDGFQFMSKWKVAAPVDVELEQKMKEKFGDKKLVVITGTSSGLGRKTALALLRTGQYHVVGAVRDLDKMEVVAELDGYDMNNFTPMHCELTSFESVRQFCQNVRDFKMGKPIDRLICNAGVYQPTLPYAKWSKDGHEQTMQINFLSHFLMISELMEDVKKSTDPRVIMVGSVTGNDNTVGGGGVYPIANLHELSGFESGFKDPVCMADGYAFDGAKAYKDSKLCLMMLSNVLHAKYHKLTGVAFSSIYPGCIAESPLFREKRKWFRKYFPIFMKFITGGFVGEEEAGQRLFQVAHDPRCGGSKSGVYWSWNGGPREDRGIEALEKGGQISGGGGAGGGWDSIFENDQSGKVLDIDLQVKLFNLATEITGANWPNLKQVNSPCPTLKVIGALSEAMIQREEAKRMIETKPNTMIATESKESSEAPVASVTTPSVTTPLPSAKKSRIKRTVFVVDKVVTGVLKNTVGRVARFAGRRVLGNIPEEAYTSSDPTITSAILPVREGQELMEKEISEQIFNEFSDDNDDWGMKSDQELIAEAMSTKQVDKPKSMQM
jgi:protochlorophyllide reductase